MAVLSIRLLGLLEVTLDHTPLTAALSAKARALLSYLAVEMHRPHSRETLASLLWPEVPSQTARSSLRGALRELRHVLDAPSNSSPFLCVTRDAIQFNSASSYWLDVQAFERAVFESPSQLTHDVERLLAASVLYRGRFLDELVVGAAPFEEWALLQREVLDREAIEALDQLSEALEARGDYAKAKEILHRQLELNPWREEAHRQLMRLFALDGQRSAALAQYESCRRALGHELGVEPSLETKRLYQQIRDDLLIRPARWIPENRAGHSAATEPDETPDVLAPGCGDRHQTLTRLVALLEAAAAGHGALIFVNVEFDRDGKTCLGVQELDHRGLLCLRDAAVQALGGA